MNFLQIALTNKCNFSCWHCPMGIFRNNNDIKWPLCNEELIPWFDRFILSEKDKWIVELTGGEPSLYNGINELLNYLNDNKIYTLVKTNGSGNLPHYENIKLVAAFHKLNEPPTNFDEILIVDKIDRQEKEAYCLDNNIKYQVIGFNKEKIDDVTHKFTYCTFINPAGHVTGCCADPPKQLVGRDGVDYNRIRFKGPSLIKCCPNCKAAIDAWRFLPDKIKFNRSILYA